MHRLAKVYILKNKVEFTNEADLPHCRDNDKTAVTSEAANNIPDLFVNNWYVLYKENKTPIAISKNQHSLFRYKNYLDLKSPERRRRRAIIKDAIKTNQTSDKTTIGSEKMPLLIN